MINCVGVGPGDLSYITRKAQKLIEEADVIAGFDSVLNIIASINPGAEFIALSYKNQTERLEHLARSHFAGQKCILAFMGDIHFSGFQLLERIETICKHPVSTIPGISSAQILASRTRVCFDETTFITFHRRGDLEPFREHLLHVLADHRNAIVIPRPWDFMPKDIARFLIENGTSRNTRLEVWENLTGIEAEWKGELQSCTRDFTDMSIMLIRSDLSACDAAEPGRGGAY